MINGLSRTAFSVINRIQDKLPPYIEAHRGIHTAVPENTLEAFEQAIAEKIDSIELDIWLTKDKIPVIIHGGSKGELPLPSLVPIKINDILFEDLPKYPIQNHVIPSLESVFRLCKDKIFINMEMKELQVKEGFDKVIQMIEKFDMGNQVAFSSYNFNYWKELVASINLFEFGYIGNYYNDMTLKNVKTTWNIYHQNITKTVVENAHQKNIGVMAWFSLKDKESDELYKSLFDNGIDVLCSNYPVQAKKYRDKYFKLI